MTRFTQAFEAGWQKIVDGLHKPRDEKRQLKAAGTNDSWASLRTTLSVQRRVTASLRRKDGRTIHVRKSTAAEPALMKIYPALALNPAPGGTKKLIN